jgi:hypothetical protein
MKAESTATIKEKDFQIIKLNRENGTLKEENDKLKGQKATREFEIMNREEDLNKKIEIFLKKEAEARMAVSFFTKKLKDKDQLILTLEIQVDKLKKELANST